MENKKNIEDLSFDELRKTCYWLDDEQFNRMYLMINKTSQNYKVVTEDKMEQFIYEDIIEQMPEVEFGFGVQLGSFSIICQKDGKLKAFCEVRKIDETKLKDDTLICIVFYNSKHQILDLQYTEIIADTFHGFTILEWYPFEPVFNIDDVSKVLFIPKADE